MTPMLGESGTEQFEVRTLLNGCEIGRQKIHDPFVHTTVVIGWWDLLRSLLRRKAKVQVVVSGSHSAQRRIMTMNPVELAMENQAWIEECKQRRTYGGESACVASTK